MRSHLFLQGPHGPFFYQLGKTLLEQGDAVLRINFCGGDVVDWPRPHARLFRKKNTEWAAWIADVMDAEKITDLYVFGDWRPLHREAVLLAKLRGIRIWAFEEGYLRPYYITMEENGVNGLSALPKSSFPLHRCAERCPKGAAPQKMHNAPSAKIWRAIAHYAGTIFLWWLFPHFTTHRPQRASAEVWGWIMRTVTKPFRLRRSAQALHYVYRKHLPYFLFPLQLDSDSQVRHYSPYSGMKEAIACVLTSFAAHAPCTSHLVIRNHPLDNGLINYAHFIQSFARACGIADRVHFVESGNANIMMKKSLGLVLLNSTIGLTALNKNLPVYCLGNSIYAMRGLAVSRNEMPLDDFWTHVRPPFPCVLEDFKRVLRHKALVSGHFYTQKGIDVAIKGVLERIRA